MRIEKIELIGFKSFAEKTAFQLHPGITCIVGPNGSGKSNIVDSFRWVLGEQSAKSLRGEKMEEVIFNGSTSKKPRGMSEVNLVLSFDSPDRGNGDSGNLTSVARRLYRSGDSEYLINRNSCRLRDIKDLFLDTGLEIKSYSILEQGRIGEILNSKPQDRRFLIEEVAGVMKYKVRRAEALSKLESSRINLQRINDIVAEIKRQINSMDRQVKKAERYKRLSSEMRSIELKLAKRDYADLKNSLDRIIAESNALKEEDASVRAELHKIENIIETRRISLLDREKLLDSLSSEFYGFEKEIAETERAIAVAVTEENNLTEYARKLAQQESDTGEKIAGIENRIKELDSMERDLTGEMDALREELSDKNDAVKALEGEFFESEELMESKRKEIFRLAEEMSHLRNEMSRFLASADNIDRKHAALEKEIETTKSRLDGLEEDLENADKAIIARNNDLLLLNERKAKLIADIDEGRIKLEVKRDELSRAREETASASSRLTSLVEIVHEDFSMDALGEHVPVMASIAEIIDVDETYEKAIENALSEKIKGFIIRSFEDIFPVTSELREKKIGRTVFCPLNLSSLDLRDSYDWNSGEYQSVVGRASDLVRVHSDDFAGVIKALMDNIVVVKDISAALTLFSESKRAGNNGRPTFVTLEGETVESSGAVSIGEGKGILRRKREIKELGALIENKKSEVERLGETLAAMETSFQEKKSSLKDIESIVIEAEKEISLMRLSAENLRDEKDKTGRKLSYINIEGEDLVREKSLLKETLSEKESGIEGINAKKIEAEGQISAMQDAMSRNKDRYEVERASITEVRVSLNSFEERIESLNKERESSGKMLSELGGKLEDLAKEKTNLDSRIRQCREEIAGNNDAIKSLVLKADNLKTIMAEHKEIIRSESEELMESEHRSKAHRSRLDSLTAVINETDISIAEHRLKIENLSGNVRQNYDIDISSFDCEPVLAEEENRLSEIRSKIQELGPVNLGTLDEYEELKTRYEFLSKQQEDLNKSIAELEEAITKINSTTRRKLREAFELLDAKFSEVFTLLFGGGKAGLVMTEENNILDSGIDIIVQPPGKKLQNINLLSGGEKALTALSLLFSSFLIKPSPLCILDEVDAALDESNIDRFAKMLRELSKEIQFIVVTHNRATMEAADYIYGITMEEPGVSKVISMQLV